MTLNESIKGTAQVIEVLGIVKRKAHGVQTLRLIKFPTQVSVALVLLVWRMLHAREESISHHILLGLADCYSVGSFLPLYFFPDKGFGEFLHVLRVDLG